MPGYEYRGSTKNEPTIIRGRVPGKNGKPLALCGTYSGYRRHMRDNERTCVDCRRAHAQRRAKQRGTPYTGHTRNKLGETPCGTKAGFEQHQTLGTRPCLPCYDAQNKYQRDRRARLKKEAA